MTAKVLVPDNRIKATHRARVAEELKIAGVSRYGLWKMESRYLPKIIHPTEHIGGVAYGLSDNGSAMLIATDRRVIFLDRKPLFVNEEEITYNVVAGVSYSHAGPSATVVLHTRIRDYHIQSLNINAVQRFVHFIELRCLEHTQEEEYEYDHAHSNWLL